MRAEHLLDSGCLGDVVVWHGVAVSTDEIDVFRFHLRLVESHRHYLRDRSAAFVDLSEMRALAGARKAKDTGLNVSPSRPSAFFIFNHHDRGSFGENQTRSQLVERTACFLGCSRPLRKNADGMKEHQRVCG